MHGLARDGRDWRRIEHVVISHFHTDHLGDLPALLWAWMHGVSDAERRPRTLIGPLGLERVLDAFAEAYGEHVWEPGSPLELVELGPHDVWEPPSGDFRLRAHKTMHTDESVAWRVEFGGSAIGYTGDTGPHAPLGSFMSGTDVLIAECAVPDGAGAAYHLSPTQVGDLAAEAQPGILVITHLYPVVEREGLEERIRSRGFQGVVEVARDGLVIEA